MLLGTPTVILSLKRYDELIAKETVYEIKRQEIMHSKYATKDEKRLFNAFAEETEDASDKVDASNTFDITTTSDIPTTSDEEVE